MACNGIARRTLLWGRSCQHKVLALFETQPPFGPAKVHEGREIVSVGLLPEPCQGQADRMHTGSRASLLQVVQSLARLVAGTDSRPGKM